MIKAEKLSKSFKDFKALDDISLTVKKGEIVGVLGVNGAGKTTLMRLITKYYAPSSGEVSCETFGYMPEGAPLYPEMTVHDFLKFVGKVQKAKEIDTAIQMAQLSDVLNTKIEFLSKGFKRRTALAAALVHNPPVLLLDEPTEGLDPNQKNDLRKILKGLSQTKAILLSTHILEEVRNLCTRAVMIDDGKLVAELKPKDFGSLENRFEALRKKPQ